MTMKTCDLRLPPQNLEAEQAVLGAILMDHLALDRVVTLIKPDCFYKDAHNYIYSAMLDLHRQGEPVDTVTLINLLEKNGRTAKVGGAYYITGLAEAVPSAANVEHYAEIVREKWIAREIIGSCNEVIGGIYQEGMERSEAETILTRQFGKFDVGRGPVDLSGAMAELRGAVESSLREPGKIQGRKTGFVDLDALTCGLGDEDLVIIGGRPSMGKTSLALDITRYIAQAGDPVLWFSIESSISQITRRLVLQESRVDGHRLRGGYLSQDEAESLEAAAKKIEDLPIFIDDRASQSMENIHSISRRTKDKHGLALVVIDYLQRMGGHRARGVSRTEEVGEYSRRAKQIAKELEVNVIVVSQLSRDVERRPNHRPTMSDLRDCVSGDTLVVLCDGRRVPISNLVGQTPSVVAVSPKGDLIEATSEKVWLVGKKPVYDVCLASGRTIRVTAGHRLRGPEGWREVSDLQVGDRLAVSHFLPEPSSTEFWPDQRVALLGQLIGDGSYLKGQSIKYTTSSDENSHIVEKAAREEFGAKVTRYAGRRTWHQLLISGNGNRWHPAGVNRWLRDLGIFDQRSYEKRIPTVAFRLGNDQIALLLRHLWATDGTIYTSRSDQRGSIHYSTNSWGLASDVAALLLRLGIVARIQTAQQGNYRPINMVKVSGAKDQMVFIERVGAFGLREKQAQKLTNALDKVKPNTNVDTLPIEFWDYVRMRMKQKGISYRRMAALRGTSYGGSSRFRYSPSRKTLMEYAEILNDEILRQHCTNDLFWDKVVSVQLAGEEEVYDLTVPGPASWLADGIISHNSGGIEQEADHVWLLYRPGYYKDVKVDEKGAPVGDLAELELGKHRNGPTGTVRLTWNGKSMTFRNYFKDPELPF